MKINLLCCYIALSMLKDVKVCKRQGKGVSGECVMAVYGAARCSEQCWSGLSLTDTPTPATTTQCYHLSSSVIHTFREDFTWSIKYHHHSSVAVNMSSLAWLTLQPQEMVTYFIKARNDISMEPNKVVDEIVSESWPLLFRETIPTCGFFIQSWRFPVASIYQDPSSVKTYCSFKFLLIKAFFLF